MRATLICGAQSPGMCLNDARAKESCANMVQLLGAGSDLPNASRGAGMADEPIQEDEKGRQDILPAASAALLAGKSLRDGFDAIVSVRTAAKRHAEARSRARQLKADIDASASELGRREQIEGNFEQIVQDQRAAIEGAQESIRSARDREVALAREKETLEGQLEGLKAKNEEDIRPYRELMESTRGRSDDAARSLSELKRAVKAADQQVTESAKRREQRIAGANRAVDSALDRLRKTEADLTSLQRDPNAAPSAISKTQRELVAEQAHLDAARDEVTRVTAECQRAVESAQTHLWTQRQSLETVERQADDAKRAATARREEFESLFNGAQEREKALAKEISQRSDAISDAQAEAEAATRQLEEAQEALDEAVRVHETPELSEQLRESIARLQDERASLEADIEELAAHERELRGRTRRQRLVFLGALAALLVVVVALLVLLLPR